MVTCLLSDLAAHSSRSFQHLTQQHNNLKFTNLIPEQIAANLQREIRTANTEI